MKHKFSSMGRVAIALVLALSLSLIIAAPVAAVSPQFLDVVPVGVTTGEWTDTVEATVPQAGTHSYHVALPTDASGVGLDIIHKYIYGPTGVGTMTLPDITSMTFWEYVKVPGAPSNLGAGITLYMDMNGDGLFDWGNDAQIVLESPYNSAQVLDNIDIWALRDITTFAGFQKGGGSLGGDFTGVDGVTPENSPWADWQTSAYSTYPVLWVGIVAGWGFYGNYDGYFDDFTINGDTYYLDLFSDLPLASRGTEPAVTTLAATNVDLYSATLNSDLTDMGGASPVYMSFQWDIDSGEPYTYTTSPVAVTATGPFSVNQTGLTHNTTYYFRAKAAIDGGLIRYGGELSFTTLTEQIGISVAPTSIDFGSMPIGQPSSSMPVNVTNTGDVDVDLTATIENESHPPVYADGLAIEGGTVALWAAPNIAPDTTTATDLVLTVPLGTPVGTYTATLIFWAEATGP